MFVKMVTNKTKLKKIEDKNLIMLNEVFFDQHFRVLLSRQAQLCLASVYSQDPVKDGSKSVHYLKMAAERGVSSLLDASRTLSLAFFHSCFTSPPSVPSQ